MAQSKCSQVFQTKEVDEFVKGNIDINMTSLVEECINMFFSDDGNCITLAAKEIAGGIFNFHSALPNQQSSLKTCIERRSIEFIAEKLLQFGIEEPPSPD
jgi:hypothetical protein